MILDALEAGVPQKPWQDDRNQKNCTVVASAQTKATPALADARDQCEILRAKMQVPACS